MIKVNVLRDENGRILCFKCEGHAGYAKRPSDKDMVCAAVSAVIYTALGYMQEYFKMQDFKEKDGFIEWTRPEIIENSIIERISAALDAMTVGIKQIEAQYGKYVKVVDEEV